MSRRTEKAGSSLSGRSSQSPALTPRETGRQKPSPEHSGTGRPASPSPFTQDSNSETSSGGASPRGGSPNRSRAAKGQTFTSPRLAVPLPAPPASARSLAGFPFGLPVPARPAASPWKLRRARCEGAVSGFVAWCPKSCLSGAGASPARPEAVDPKALRCKRSCGPGDRRGGGGGVLAAGWLGHSPAGRCRTSAPGRDPTAPEPNLPRPKCPPESPSLEVTWMLKPGPSSHAPPPPGALELSPPALPRQGPPLPLPELRLLLERSRLQAQRLPPDICLATCCPSPFRRIQETFISISPLHLLPLPPLFFFS